MSELLEGPLILTRVAPRLVVDQAPPVTRFPLALIAAMDSRELHVDGNRITVADQVVYRVTGWDPTASALVAERVDDFRPGR